MDSLAVNRARLAQVERELTRLHEQHDLAMSAFRFEEATALGPAIAALEQEQQALAAALPTDRGSPTGVVPLLLRSPRRGRSRRRG